MKKINRRMVTKIDYKKLKKDLLKKVGTLKSKPLVAAADIASETDLLKLAKTYNLNISDYIND
ncbi:MAG TPA: hypothetical protein VIK86_00190 [Candidatus Paceibacterota bacterium]